MGQCTPILFVISLVPSGRLRTLHPLEVFGEALPLVKVEEHYDGWDSEGHY